MGNDNSLAMCSLKLLSFYVTIPRKQTNGLNSEKKVCRKELCSCSTPKAKIGSILNIFYQNENYLIYLVQTAKGWMGLSSEALLEALDN